MAYSKFDYIYNNERSRRLFVIDLDYTLLDTKRITDHIRNYRVPLFLGKDKVALFEKAYLKARTAGQAKNVDWKKKPHTDVRIACKELARLMKIPELEFMIYHSLFASIDFSDFLLPGAIILLKAIKLHGGDIIINTEGESSYQEMKLKSCGIGNYVDILNKSLVPDKMDPSHISIDIKLDGISYLSKNYEEIYIIDDKLNVLKSYNKHFPNWKYILSDYGPYAESFARDDKQFITYSGRNPDEIHRQLFPQDFVPIEELTK